MATPKRGSGSGGEADIPKDFPNVPAPTSPMLDHSFTLQAVMELQKTVAGLETRMGRVLTDLSDQDKKLDDIIGKISFMKGVIYVSGGMLTLLVALFGLVSSGRISTTLKP